MNFFFSSKRRIQPLLHLALELLLQVYNITEFIFNGNIHIQDLSALNCIKDAK